MDGKDKIIEQILQDADLYSKEVIEKADGDYEAAVNSAKENAETLLCDAKKDFEAEETETLRRRKVVASLDGKKLYLSKKTEAVSEVFYNALEKLNKLDKSAYKSIICRLIKENAASGATVVIPQNCPFTQNEVCNFDVVKELNLKVKNGGNFNGGVVIESQTSDVNLSFEAIIDGLKERYETYVAEKLFD